MFNPKIDYDTKPFNNFDIAGIQNQVNEFKKSGLQSCSDFGESNSGVVSIVTEGAEGTLVTLQVHKIAINQGILRKGTHWAIKIFFLECKEVENKFIATVDAKTQTEALVKAGTEIINYMVWREHNRQIHKPLNNSDMKYIQGKIVEFENNGFETYSDISGKDLGIVAIYVKNWIRHDGSQIILEIHKREPRETPIQTPFGETFCHKPEWEIKEYLLDANSNDPRWKCSHPNETLKGAFEMLMKYIKSKYF